MKWAALFPGQGSQKPGMGHDLYEKFSTARSVFNRVASATNINIQEICFEYSDEDLRMTDRAQLALYTCGVAAYQVFAEETGDQALVAAGHSVGEYGALVCAGAISVEAGAMLIARRGELMKVAEHGAMAAVLGLDSLALQAVLDGVDDIVVIANDNCPGQLVISGTPSGVKIASEMAIFAGAKRVLPLNVSGAFHSPLMAESATKMSVALGETEWQQQRIPVISNTIASQVSDSSQWAGLLERQLSSSVRWTESMQLLADQTDCEIAFEFGSGEVLTGLMKRISKEFPSVAVYDQASLSIALERLK